MDGYKADLSEKQHKSKEKLRQSCISKMKTIMIGALSDIETKDPDELRKSILDRGNSLIRSFEEELEKYDIMFRGEFYTFIRKG